MASRALPSLCRREGIAEGLYYSHEGVPGSRQASAGRRHGACGDEQRGDGFLRREARTLKEVVAEQALEPRLLKKSMIADGEDGE